MAKKDVTKKVIPAVAYLRKSTNEERTEKSIADQRARVAKLLPVEDNTCYEIVRWYDKDKGVPGWKRGAKRPDFDRLVNELKATGAKAILVDDMDRFSRADEFEVMHDVQELREFHGVRYIHAANQGCFDVVKDQFAAMKIAMSAMAGHEFSARLSRRVANARLDAAKKGLRSGGGAPYGMMMADADGEKITPATRIGKDGKLRIGRRIVPGDSKLVKIVQWIFDQWVNKLRSMNWIAAELNRKGIPASRGGRWYVSKIKEVLQRHEYRGDFTYNAKKSGQFHITVERAKGEYEVVPISNYHDDKPQPWKATDEGMIFKAGVYKSIIAPKVFDAAQKRFATLALKGSRKPRTDGYPLSRILYCGHCGKPMYGCLPTGRKYRVYRCRTNSLEGMGSCGTYEVREELILPFVLRKFGEEIKDLIEKLTFPPDELRYPNAKREERQRQTKAQRDKLAKKINVAMAGLWEIEDDRTRKEMEAMISVKRDELAKLEAELSVEQPTKGYNRDDLKKLNDWWEDFQKRAVSVPVKDKIHLVAATFYQDPFSDEQAVLLDARVVNEALHELGGKVELQWNTERVTLRSGKEQNRYRLAKGRLQLGQRNWEIPVKTGVTFRNSLTAALSSCNSGASRHDSRRDTGSMRQLA